MDEPTTEIPNDPNQPDSSKLNGYTFDTEYFRKENPSGEYITYGGVAIFRLTNGQDEKYLHLFNLHNGYYSHGFELVNQKEDLQNVKIREGYI